MSLFFFRSLLCHGKHERRGRPGIVTLILALLAQMLMPAWAMPLPQADRSATFALADTLDPSSICRSEGENTAAHDQGFSCANSHFCCQLPLLLGPVDLPLPRSVELGLIESIRVIEQWDPPRATACARAPPVSS